MHGHPKPCKTSHQSLPSLSNPNILKPNHFLTFIPTIPIINAHPNTSHTQHTFDPFSFISHVHEVPYTWPPLAHHSPNYFSYPSPSASPIYHSPSFTLTQSATSTFIPIKLITYLQPTNLPGHFQYQIPYQFTEPPSARLVIRYNRGWARRGGFQGFNVVDSYKNNGGLGTLTKALREPSSMPKMDCVFNCCDIHFKKQRKKPY